MKEMMKIEFKRAFRSRTFYLSLLIGMVICIAEYIICVIPCTTDMVSGYKRIMPHHVFDSWIGQAVGGTMYTYIYTLLIPILSVLAYAGSYCTDRKTGYIKNLYSRSSKGAYLSAKYLASVAAGGVAVLLPLICNLLATAAVLPSLVPEATAGNMTPGPMLWSVLLYTKPYVFIVLHLILIFFYQAMYVGIALAVSEFADHIFLIWLFPFLLNYFVNTMLSFIGYPYSRYSPMDVLDMRYMGVEIWGTLIQWIVIMALVSFIFLCKGARDETY